MCVYLWRGIFFVGWHAKSEMKIGKIARFTHFTFQSESSRKTAFFAFTPKTYIGLDLKRLKRLCGLLLLTFWYVHLRLFVVFDATERKFMIYFFQTSTNGFFVFLFLSLFHFDIFLTFESQQLNFKATGNVDSVSSFLFHFRLRCV